MSSKKAGVPKAMDSMRSLHDSNKKRPGLVEMNEKASVQEGLLELLALEEGNAEDQISQRIAWLCASMRDDHVRRTCDVECCTPVPISCCSSPKWWNTKGKQILRTLRS